MELTVIILFLSATTCITALDTSDGENVVKRQAQSYNWHLKPVSGKVKEKTCLDHYKSGKRYNDMYRINPDGKGSFFVMCEMTGGGWTLFQHRYDGFLNFYRKWQDYKKGFGSILGEFWLGLEKIHRITSSRKMKLRIDLEDFVGNKVYAEYTPFRIGNEHSGYKLNIGEYSDYTLLCSESQIVKNQCCLSRGDWIHITNGRHPAHKSTGTAGDSLSYHNNMRFSTKDADHDRTYWINCAQAYHGAWWYRHCHYSNLNGLYYKGGKHKSYADGINWYHWKGYYYSMKTVTMKMKEV